MKLIVQIPCLDEAETLPLTLAELPRRVPGFDAVEWLVVDDGSADGTAEVARRHGVDHVVRLPVTGGLANAFQAGLDAALKLGADVIVNTDGDNQYAGADVARLVAPIVAGAADVVVGDRRLASDPAIPAIKRRLARLGARVARRAWRANVADPASGFRAYSREAALQLQVVTDFTYTLESLVQAARAPIALAQVPVRTNPGTRPSRLFSSPWVYVRRNATALLRVYSHYEPRRVFWAAALALLVAALAAAVWSLLLGAVLLNAALVAFGLGVLGDVLHSQRVLTQRTLERVRRIELAVGVAPARHEGAQAAPERLRERA